MSTSSKPRVLHMVTHLALGGAERVALNLMQGLRDRYDFALYATLGADAGDIGQAMKSEVEDLRVPLYLGVNAPMRYGGMFLGGMWAAHAVKQFKPAAIHVHTEIPEAAYAALVSMRPAIREIPLVRTIHNALYWGSWRKVGRWCDKRMQHAHVACVSSGAQEAFEKLRAESGAGPLPQPPVTVLNGIRVTDAPRPLGKLPAQRVRILFAGRFEEQKGADLLPEILSHVKPREGQELDLVICGSGKYESTLRALAAAPPAGWTIQVNGPVPNLSSQMPQFDLMIMPSRHEGLALMAIEAALLGLPTIATNGPGVREGFPQTYPWLADAGDAASFASLLQRAVDAPESWSTVVQQAQDFAGKHFNLRVMCDAYGALYERALRPH